MFEKFRLMAKNVASDIECGWHSGFRPCCIAYFSLVRTPAHYYWKSFYNGTIYFTHLFCLIRDDDGAGYIPCPRCEMKGIRISRKKIKKCEDKPHLFSFSDSELKRARKYLGIPDRSFGEDGILYMEEEVLVRDKNGKYVAVKTLTPWKDKVGRNINRMSRFYYHATKSMKWMRRYERKD